MSATMELAAQVPTSQACQALSQPRSSFYRALAAPRPRPAAKPRPKPVRALSESERERARALLNTEFVDAAPRTAYGALLDRAEHVCGWRTMYRLLAEEGESNERRRQRRHAKRVKPQLCATRPSARNGLDQRTRESRADRVRRGCRGTAVHLRRGAERACPSPRAGSAGRVNGGRRPSAATR